MGEIGNRYKIIVGNQNLGDPSTDGRIILKLK
jgi:hypothetical protein